MRCLALAEAARPRATDIHFICRQLDGDLHSLIEAKGFRCSLLPTEQVTLDPEADAERTAALSDGVDWLVVDHYEID